MTIANLTKLSLLIVFSGFGCGSPETEDTGSTTETELIPSEYIDDDTEINPLLTVEQVSVGLAEGLDWLFNFNPDITHETYLEVLGYGYGAGGYGGEEEDYGCPYYYDGYDYDYWRDTCQREDGTSFSGFAQSWNYGEYEENGYKYYNYDYFNGDARIVTPEGQIWIGAGYNQTYRREYLENGYQYIYRNIAGEFSWEGPTADGSWMQESVAVDFYVHVRNYATEDEPSRVYTSMNGGVSGLLGDINTITLVDVMIYDDTLGSVCDLEPYGTISVRDDDGGWYDVIFDGPPYWGGWSYESVCDGCGEAFYRGESIGSVCVDFTQWIDWQGMPW